MNVDRREPTRRYPGGFTIIELLIVLAVAALLGMMATANFTNTIARDRINGELADLQADMTYAAAEAVREGLLVTLCASSDGLTCSKSTNWNDGWIVFADPAGDQTLPTGASILHHHTAFIGNDTLVADNSVWYISYNRGGYINNIATTIPSVTFTDHASPASTYTTACLAVTFMGLVSQEVSGQGACL